MMKTIAIVNQKETRFVIKETSEIFSRPDWMERIKKSKEKIREGETISHEELGKQLGFRKKRELSDELEGPIKSKKAGKVKKAIEKALTLGAKEAANEGKS